MRKAKKVDFKGIKVYVSRGCWEDVGDSDGSFWMLNNWDIYADKDCSVGVSVSFKDYALDEEFNEMCHDAAISISGEKGYW